MSKLKIQKISNGQFCTAAQWAQDALECKKKGIIDAYHFEMPSLTKEISEAQERLDAMIALYPEVSAALKIGLLCGVANSIESTNTIPRVIIHSTITLYGTPRCTLADMFEASDKALRDHIEEQREIVRKHNLMEI